MTIYHDSIDDSSTGSGEVRETCVPLTIGWRENLFRFSWIDVHTYQKILPWLCQFSESTLLDLWPHLKYSMHPSSIFHGIPESLYYCVNCNSYPTRQISLSSQSLSSQEWEWQVKEKGFSDYSDSDSKIYGISQFLLVWNLQRLIVKLRLSQVAAVVHSDYSYSGSIPIPGKLQWLIPGRVSQSNEIDTFGKSWNKRNKDIKIHR